MSRQILAIDIRNDSLAAVLINLGLKMNTIAGTATVPVAPATEENENPLIEAFQMLRDDIDMGTANIVVALPSDGILYRKLQMPFKEDAKIRQVLPFELEPHIPIGIENLKFDFQKTQIGEHTEVLAVAIDQALLQQYQDTLTEAVIRPQLIVPGGFPLASYLSNTQELAYEQLLVLDVESEKTTIYAINAGKIELVRRLSATVEDEPAAEALALRIRQTLTAMSEQQDNYMVPAKVFMTGTGLNDPNIFERISLALELPAEQIDLRRWAPRLEMEHSVDWQPRIMNNALALAMLEADGQPCANFHRTTSPLRNFWTAYRSYITSPAVLLGIALVIGISSVMIDRAHLNQSVKALDEQIEQVYLSTFPGSKIPEGYDPLVLMKSKIKDMKSGENPSGPAPTSVRTIDVLLQVSQLIPKEIDVLFTQMTMGGDAVTISGETGDFNSVDDIKSRVEKGNLFKQVTIASAAMDKSGKKVRFKMKIDL